MVRRCDRLLTSPLLPEPSPNKSSKQKLAKLLGEESVLETEREPIRSPPEKPFYLGADYADNDIIMNADGTVKAGTLPALVERLTTHEQLGKASNHAENFSLPD